MQDGDLGRRELLVGHRAVGGAEVDRALGDLPDATPAADRLVVDLEVGEAFVEFVEPLGVDRVREGRPRARDEYRGARRDRGERETQNRSHPDSLSHVPLLSLFRRDL